MTIIALIAVIAAIIVIMAQEGGWTGEGRSHTDRAVGLIDTL